MSRAARARLLLAWLLLATACGRSNGAPAPTPGTSAPASSPAASAPGASPPVRSGMIWIPAGVLVAGTPLASVPRVASEEMPGEQVSLHGFLIDELPYPNEPGAIPRTGLSRDAAAEACARDGKRLCTELEWEHACKGPENTTYAWGDDYRAGPCELGGGRRLAPAGVHTGCKSAFGVRDLHGGAWEWTASAWGRGASPKLATIRGGSGADGDRIGRCANGAPLAPTVERGDIGFRCCAGDVNEVEVTLSIDRGKPLAPRSLGPELEDAFARLLARAASVPWSPSSALELPRGWTWRPVDNEQLVLAAACAKGGEHRECAVGVARATPRGTQLLVVVPSGWWAPEVHLGASPDVIDVFGGDARGQFRRRVTYSAARITVEPSRRGGKEPAP